MTSFQKNDQEVMVVQGPLEIKWSERGFFFSSQIGVRLPVISTSFFVDAHVELTGEKNYAKLIMNHNTKLLVGYVHELTYPTPAVGVTQIVSTIQIPMVWDSKFELKSSEMHLEISGTLEAPIASPRKIEVHANFMGNRPYSGHFSTKLQYDVLRDPQKLLALSGDIAFEDQQFLSQ